MWAIQPGAAQTRQNAGGGSAPSSLLTSLVAYWTLDEASGSRADSVGSNTLTDNNTVTQNPGKVGNAAQFTAANSEYLSSASNSALQTGDVDWTIACWAYLDANTNLYVMAAKQDSNLREYSLYFDNGDNRLHFATSSSGSSLDKLVTATTLGAPATATWYLIIAWHDAAADTNNIQVNNGTVDSLAGVTGLFVGSALFAIGRSGNFAGGYMAGRIDEVGLWKRVLTTAERTALYNGGAGITYPFPGT